MLKKHNALPGDLFTRQGKGRNKRIKFFPLTYGKEESFEVMSLQRKAEN